MYRAVFNDCLNPFAIHVEHYDSKNFYFDKSRPSQTTEFFRSKGTLAESMLEKTFQPRSTVKKLISRVQKEKNSTTENYLIKFVLSLCVLTVSNRASQYKANLNFVFGVNK